MKTLFISLAIIFLVIENSVTAKASNQFRNRKDKRQLRQQDHFLKEQINLGEEKPTEEQYKAQSDEVELIKNNKTSFPFLLKQEQRDKLISSTSVINKSSNLSVIQTISKGNLTRLRTKLDKAKKQADDILGYYTVRLKTEKDLDIQEAIRLKVSHDQSRSKIINELGYGFLEQCEQALKYQVSGRVDMYKIELSKALLKMADMQYKTNIVAADLAISLVDLANLLNNTILLNEKGQWQAQYHIKQALKLKPLVTTAEKFAKTIEQQKMGPYMLILGLLFGIFGVAYAIRYIKNMNQSGDDKMFGLQDSTQAMQRSQSMQEMSKQLAVQKKILSTETKKKFISQYTDKDKKFIVEKNTEDKIDKKNS